MLERGFWIFLLLFSEFSCPGQVWMEFGTKIFLSFLAYLIPFWLKIMPERGFLIFWIFLLFFSEFSCPGRVWKKFETKSFLFFPAYLVPFWLKIMPECGFLIFFFRIFLPGSIMNGTRDKIFSLFPGLSHPVLAKNNAGKRFFNFWIFLLFFSEFSCPGRAWTEFETKIFFSHSRPMLSHVG